ncbi:MAG TPA: hypothetical protein DDZ83_00325 [Nitrospinae bacterium]|nr:hypothetical protein [Nitrospinota bacterium]
MHRGGTIPSQSSVTDLWCFILGSILISSFVQPQQVFSGEKRRSNSAASPYRGPIIDAHNHPKRKKIHLKEFFGEAKAANVEKVIVMTTPNDYRKGEQRLLRNARNYSRAIILCSSNFVGFIHVEDLDRARRELRQVREDLKNGVCGGVGEVGLRHYDKTAKQGGNYRGQPEVLINLDHALVLEMISLADRHGAPVVMHIEPVYRVAGIDKLSEVKKWYKKTCRRYPRAKLIASHNGMMSPKDLEDLFLSCANLFADIKFLHSRGLVAGFQDLHPMNDLDLELFPHWGQMIKKYPERFIFGSDWKYGRRRSFGDYTGHLRAVRKMLEVLAPTIQRKVLYENAKRVFSID